MNSNLNKNQNFGDNQNLISQAEKNDYNNNNLNQDLSIKKSISRKKEESQYIQKKRKKAIEDKKEEYANKLNEIEIFEVMQKNVLLFEHEIEKKEKKKINLKEDIQKMQKELDELNAEIEKYEKIKNSNLQIIKILGKNEIAHEEKDETKNIKNNKNEENKLFSFGQNLNLSNQFVNNSTIMIKELNEPTIIQTEITNENKNSVNEDSNEEPVTTAIVFKILGKNKFLNKETVNNKIEENNNN